ncbi:MAG TPA: hypothetical protein VKI65_07565, partial [Gemmataceae bacterium]|nr:hypothetical protein [Gemmataceae bacterium]
SSKFTTQFVMTRMIPGTALGVLFGDLIYTGMAFRLARRTGRANVTAMPLGLDTPSTIGVALFILPPALHEGWELYGSHNDAMLYAWHVGLLLLVLIGVFKVACSPLGNAVRRWVPRAGLLGSLAAIALVLIAFLPLSLHIANVPVVGFLALTIILVTLVAHRALPGRIPGALAAVLIGVGGYYACLHLGELTGWAIVPPLQTPGEATAWQPPVLIPDLQRGLHWWQQVWLGALARLPIALPFAVATIVGGIDCTESAAAAGDEYDTRTILLTEGVASVAAGCLGGVIQTTPYIGHPAYKAMGGRAAYTLATALFIGAAGYFGWFTHVFERLPEAAMFPILVFVGLEITAQSFRATPVRHYAALAFATLPALAKLITIPLDQVVGGQPVNPEAAVALQPIRELANGFIVTSLLWGAALAALLDGRLVRSAGWFVTAAACALVGIIHSPFAPERIELPHQAMEHLPEVARFQSPYHWAAAYGLTAVVLVGLSFFRDAEREEKKTPPENTQREPGRD